MIFNMEFFMKNVIYGLFLGFVVCSANAAVVSSEQLQQQLPVGWKVGFKNANEAINVIEYIPNSQDINNWGEMITTQTINNPQIPHKLLHDNVWVNWTKACPGAKAEDLPKGVDKNGFISSGWIFSCDSVPLTKKPEYTMFKVITGFNSTYIVQKSIKVKEVPANYKNAWWTYLSSIYVCDSKRKDKPCNK